MAFSVFKLAHHWIGLNLMDLRGKLLARPDSPYSKDPKFCRCGSALALRNQGTDYQLQIWNYALVELPRSLNTSE